MTGYRIITSDGDVLIFADFWEVIEWALGEVD